VSADAVNAHESGPAFHAYKDALRPLVDPDSLAFGNTELIAVRGYTLPADDGLACRFIQALGTNDGERLDALYDPDVVLYTPFAWPVRGRDAVKAFVEQFHLANPGLRARCTTSSREPTAAGRASGSCSTSTTPARSTAIHRRVSAAR
jgi:SnoaL-like domain